MKMNKEKDFNNIYNKVVLNIIKSGVRPPSKKLIIGSLIKQFSEK